MQGNADGGPTPRGKLQCMKHEQKLGGAPAIAQTIADAKKEAVDQGFEPIVTFGGDFLGCVIIIACPPCALPAMS